MKTYIATCLMLLLPLSGWADASSSRDISSASLPPSALLSYQFSLKQGLISASGTSTIQWTQHYPNYVITTQAKIAIIGSILSVKSQGSILPNGLQVTQFDENSFIKKAQHLQFDWDNKRYTQLGKPPHEYSLTGLTFDRANIIWQLSLLLNTNPEWQQAHHQFILPVAEPNGLKPWQFMVIGPEKLTTPLGALDTIHIKRLPNQRQQTLDLWFIQTQHWYPAQIYLNEFDGSYFYQTISKISQE